MELDGEEHYRIDTGDVVVHIRLNNGNSPWSAARCTAIIYRKDGTTFHVSEGDPWNAPFVLPMIELCLPVLRNHLVLDDLADV
jgi:hypothetical protein